MILTSLRSSPPKQKTTPASTPQTAVVPIGAVPSPPQTSISPPDSSRPATRAQRPRRVSHRFRDDSLGPVKLTYALKQCQNILKQLMAHKYAWPFNSPVDWEALNLPDYPDIIKHPMDLGTVKLQMEGGDYENEDEFADDVRLVWANALRYNQPGSDICIMAQELSDVFEGKFVKAKSGIDERKKSDASGMTETIKELRDSMRSVQKELEIMRKAKAANGGKNTGKKEDNRPMNFEEKKKLSLSINSLPSESLGMVVKIIHERMPQLTGQGEEIEIDIDALDPATLRALERYIKGTQRKRRSHHKAESTEKIDQAKVTEAGTQSRIEDVERRLKVFNFLHLLEILESLT